MPHRFGFFFVHPNTGAATDCTMLRAGFIAKSDFDTEHAALYFHGLKQWDELLSTFDAVF